MTITSSEKIHRAAFVFAMQQEAQPFVDAMLLEEQASDLGLSRVFCGKLGSVEIIVSVNGVDARFGVDRIGTEAAVLNSFQICSKFRPSLLLSAGTAGGFRRRGGLIGDVYLSAGPIYYHDHRISIPGFDQFGAGSYPSLPTRVVASLLGLKLGRISTGNSLDLNDADASVLEANEVHAKDMEAAAVAQVAYELKIPFLAFKSITDLVDGEHKSEEEFMRNLHLAAEKLREKLVAFVQFLSTGKCLNEL